MDRLRDRPRGTHASQELLALPPELCIVHKGAGDVVYGMMSRVGLLAIYGGCDLADCLLSFEYPRIPVIVCLLDGIALCRLTMLEFKEMPSDPRLTRTLH